MFENCHFSIFQKSFDRSQFSLKPDKNTRYFTLRRVYFLIISRSVLRLRNVIDKLSKKLKHILCRIVCFRKSCRLWDDVEEYGKYRQAKVGNIIRSIRLACWINKAKNTVRIRNIYCFSTATMVTRTRVSVTFTRAFPVLYSADSRNSNCQCSLFSKKSPIIRIFCTFGWLALPINPDKRSSTAHDCGTRYFIHRA
jgi:hypothetical protein